MNKTLVYGVILIAIVIALGGYFFPQVQAAFGAVTPSTTTGQYATESTGAPLWVLGNALIGPNSTGATGYVGYISTIGSRIAATSGSTTPCAIPNPLGAALAAGNATTATGTIQSFAFTVTAPTSTAVTWVVGTSTTAYATSSSLVTGTVAAGTQSTITYDGLSNNNIIGPGQFIVVGTGNGTTGVGPNTGGVIFGGFCQATVESAS